MDHGRYINKEKWVRRKGVLLLTIILVSLAGTTIYSRSPGKNEFRVDLRDQEITEFIKLMSAIIGKNIIIDERVRGKITIISPEILPRKFAYAYLSTVLALKGFGVIDTGLVLKIVPLKDAVAESPIILLGREPVESEFIENNTIVTHIVPLNSSTPSRLAGILKRLSKPETDIIDYDEIGTLILTGNANEVNRLIRVIVELDPEAGEKPQQETIGGNIHIFQLNNMPADKLEATLRKIDMPANNANQAPGNTNTPPQVQQPRPGMPGAKIDVIAHKETNSLIFMGTDEEFKVVSELIKRLDTPRDQVLLEVLIVEVSADSSNSFGIDWRFTGPGSAGQYNTGVAGSGLVPDANGNYDVTGINTLFGFSLGFLTVNGNPLTGIINANVNKDNFTILSAPQILTLDNQEATINVGEDIPIITGRRTAGAGDQATFNENYEYKNIGVSIKFTPQISNDQMVTLDLYQEIKAVSGYTETAVKNPKFTKRDIKTVVRVADNQTIVIGGLVSSNKTKNINKIPILGDIPILGFLFKKKSTAVTKTNLLVFITPHIISNRSTADTLTNESRDRQLKEFEEFNKNK